MVHAIWAGGLHAGDDVQEVAKEAGRVVDERLRGWHTQRPERFGRGVEERAGACPGEAAGGEHAAELIGLDDDAIFEVGTPAELEPVRPGRPGALLHCGKPSAAAAAD